MATKAQLAERNDATAELFEMLEPGDTVCTILRHVSRSGMSRRISLVICKDDGWPTDITWLAARAMGEPVKSRGQYVQDAGMYVSGCGMDMGFHLVYNLSRTLWPNGFDCVGREGNCPSNDHSNDRNGPDYRTDRHHNDGGYALNQRWL